MQLCWKTQPDERPEMATVVTSLLPNHEFKEEMVDYEAVEDALSSCLERCSALVFSEPVATTIHRPPSVWSKPPKEKPRPSSIILRWIDRSIHPPPSVYKPPKRRHRSSCNFFQGIGRCCSGLPVLIFPLFLVLATVVLVVVLTVFCIPKKHSS